MTLVGAVHVTFLFIFLNNFIHSCLNYIFWAVTGNTLKWNLPDTILYGAQKSELVYSNQRHGRLASYLPHFSFLTFHNSPIKALLQSKNKRVACFILMCT